MSSPTERSLKYLRDRNWDADKVEQRIPFNNITRDLFGCIDIVAMDGITLCGVQVTSGAHHAERRNKILAEPRMARWIKSGGRLLIHSWTHRGPRTRWKLREEQITLDDFTQAARAAQET